MKKKEIRVGNYVIDPRNFNYVLAADESVISNAHLFVPMPITDAFLKANGFGSEIMDSFYKEIVFEGENVGAITLAKEDDSWRVSVRGGENVYGGYISSVGELQNIVDDCHIEMEWTI